LIHSETLRPRSRSLASWPSGSGNMRGSHVKSVHWNSRIQKQSKWNTDSGRSRAAIPSTNSVTLASS